MSSLLADPFRCGVPGPSGSPFFALPRPYAARLKTLPEDRAAPFPLATMVTRRVFSAATLFVALSAQLYVNVYVPGFAKFTAPVVTT